MIQFLLRVLAWLPMLFALWVVFFCFLGSINDNPRGSAASTQPKGDDLHHDGENDETRQG